MHSSLKGFSHKLNCTMVFPEIPGKDKFQTEKVSKRKLSWEARDTVLQRTLTFMPQTWWRKWVKCKNEKANGSRSSVRTTLHSIKSFSFTGNPYKYMFLGELYGLLQVTQETKRNFSDFWQNFKAASSVTSKVQNLQKFNVLNTENWCLPVCGNWYAWTKVKN